MAKDVKDTKTDAAAKSSDKPVDDAAAAGQAADIAEWLRLRPAAPAAPPSAEEIAKAQADVDAARARADANAAATDVRAAPAVPVVTDHIHPNDHTHEKKS